MSALGKVASLIPSPSPSAVDFAKATPGIGGAVAFTFLAVALVLLLLSMNRHLKRVSFDEDSTRD